MWRGGCIIRSAFLGNIKVKYIDFPQNVNRVLFVSALAAY